MYDFTCRKRYPYTTWQVGDQVELDGMKSLKRDEPCDSYGYVRMKQRLSQNAVVPVNTQMSQNQVQAIGNSMMSRAEQSGGQYEVEFMAREEYRDNGSVSARQMG